MGLLPTKPTTKAKNLADHSILIHTPPKFGKSTLLASIPDCFIFATEPGYKTQSVFAKLITDWQHALALLAELEEGQHKYKFTGVDTIDNLFHLCVEEICAINNKEHYSLIPFRGKDLVVNEFRRFLFRLMNLPMGVILTSHTQTVSVEVRTGKYDKSIPTIHKFVRDIVLGEVDIILFGETITKSNMASSQRISKRILRSKVDSDHEAGDRTDRLDPEMELKKENGYAHIEAIYNKNRDAEVNEAGNKKEAKSKTEQKKSGSKIEKEPAGENEKKTTEKKDTQKTSRFI